ncbi:hypothetical protein ACJJTC_012802 [Scirpophaga incertulas]
MGCSQIKCKKRFHFKCLALTKEKFEALTQEHKDQWICPECVCMMPKSCNTNTPVRGTASTSKTSTPSSFVNIADRASRRNAGEIIVCDDTQLLDEIQEFRLEVKSQLEEQRKQYILLQSRFINIETELREKNIEEASLKNNQLSNQVKQGSNRGLASSFANAVKDKQVVRHNVAKECVATKSARTVDEGQTRVTNSEKKSKDAVSVQTEQLEKKGNWTTVTRKRSRFSTSEVKKGGNTSGNGKEKIFTCMAFAAGNIEKHVKKIYVEEVPITIEQIKHKTERDHASFIIGVPESK